MQRANAAAPTLIPAQKEDYVLHWSHYVIYTITVILGVLCLRYAILTIGKKRQNLIAVLSLIAAVLLFLIFIAFYYFPKELDKFFIFG